MNKQMINLKFFNDLLKKYSSYNAQRHEVIKLSSDALRTSKQVIFSLHRDDHKEAAKLLGLAEASFTKLNKLFEKDADLKSEGSYLAALEEYVEAKFFNLYLTGKSIDYVDVGFPIGYDEYLSGICDFTGELTRKAVLFAGDGKYEEVMGLKKTVEDIIAELIKFDLVGKMRVKYDEAKRNLKRLEEIVYDLKIRGYK